MHIKFIGSFHCKVESFVTNPAVATRVMISVGTVVLRGNYRGCCGLLQRDNRRCNAAIICCPMELTAQIIALLCFYINNTKGASFLCIMNRTNEQFYFLTLMVMVDG